MFSFNNNNYAANIYNFPKNFFKTLELSPTKTGPVTQRFFSTTNHHFLYISHIIQCYDQCSIILFLLL